MELELKEKQAASGWRVARTIMWSFFGVRNSQRHAADTINLTWSQIILAGITGGGLFVLTLLTIVNLIVP